LASVGALLEDDVLLISSVNNFYTPLETFFLRVMKHVRFYRSHISFKQQFFFHWYGVDGEGRNKKNTLSNIG
jgi:hypothetical protein